MSPDLVPTQVLIAAPHTTDGAIAIAEALGPHEALRLQNEPAPLVGIATAPKVRMLFALDDAAAACQLLDQIAPAHVFNPALGGLELFVCVSPDIEAQLQAHWLSLKARVHPEGACA